MSDNYNGRPYKTGFLQDFKQMPPAMINEMVADLGIKMPIAHLTSYRSLFTKNDYRYSIDELYMADALYEQMYKTDFRYSVGTFFSESEDIKEAFADLMEKRRAMCDTTPVTLETLVSDYNAYLVAHGYDNGDEGKYTVAPLNNTDSPASTMKFRTIGSFFEHSNSPYAIARIAKPSRFNTDKMRIRIGKYGTAALSVMLIKIPETPLMYEMLSDIINAIPKLGNYITYLAPIANDGLIRHLASLGTGFSLNIDQVAKIFPDIDRPYMLTHPMSAAVLLAPPLASGMIASELLKVNFECEIIGSTTSLKHLISVNYGGFSHSVDIKALNRVVFSRPLRIFCEQEETNAHSQTADGISINVFDGFGFDTIHKKLSESIDELKSLNNDHRLTAYVCLPFSTENVDKAFTAFLAVYRALAENAIPIRMLTTFNNPENNRPCVFITDENHVSGKSTQ